MLMHRRAGFSLLELMVTITVIGILLTLGIPAFGKWTADTRVRSVAESLTNAIRATRANAVARSRITTFVMTSGTPAYNATAVSNGNNWFAGVEPLLGSTTDTASGLGISQSSTQATAYGVVVGTSSVSASTSATQAVICFNTLGQLTSQTAAQTGVGQACAVPSAPAYWTYWVTSPKATRQYQVLVYAGGQVRMCDALKTLSSTNPDGCP